MLDHFGHGFVLVMTGPAEDEPFMAAALRRGIPLRTLRIEDPTAAERYERRLVLVRPDGHVAWRGDLPPADVDALFDRISGLTDEHAVSPTDVAVASE